MLTFELELKEEIFLSSEDPVRFQEASMRQEGYG